MTLIRKCRYSCQIVVNAYPKNICLRKLKFKKIQFSWDYVNYAFFLQRAQIIVCYLANRNHEFNCFDRNIFGTTDILKLLSGSK